MIPCYNEEAVIASTYERVRRVLDQLGGNHEILIADDGSSDQSPAILEQIARRDPHFVLIAYSPNRGMGYACRQMYQRASGDFVVEMDADLAMDPADTIPLFAEHLHHHDCVVGSRYKGIEPDYPLRRRIASRGYYLINQVLFALPLKDTQSGFFGIRRDVLANLDLRSDGFELPVEMFAQLARRKHSILEVPVRFVHQTASGEVSVVRAAPKMFFNTLKIYGRLRRIPRGG